MYFEDLPEVDGATGKTSESTGKGCGVQLRQMGNAVS